ncbi:methyltransferase domain-containing protein [Streptomyces sparsogenes]|uniref:methyltransferase domain-containing protein n=1 Tax=Streptomyces sparsogenes TaxID=67365 RepID=UPI00384E0B13
MSTEATADPIVALVAGHPWVAEARAAPDGRILVRPRPSATAAGPCPGPLLREHLDHWAEVYDWVYQDAHGRHADDLDLSGWRASDTGLPLPTEHMRDWLDRTVELVLSQRPRRVLELGCGTGLLAHRLHSHLDGYVGTDVAQAAVDRLGRAGLPRTAFVRAAAHEAGTAVVRRAMDAAFGEGVRPDCVLLNSVTQCFPSVDYLTAVLHEALDAVTAPGTVIVGDIRHSGLLTHHFTWLERTRTPTSDGDTLDARVRAAIAGDEELSFAPRAVATALAAHFRPVRMSVHARTMELNTELTRYRYDLVLQVGPRSRALPDSDAVQRVRWPCHQGKGLSVALRTALSERPAILTAIPNALLGDAPGAVTPYALRRALHGLDATVLLDADDPHMLAVAAPAGCAYAAAVPPADAPVPAGPVAHEPLTAFVRRRLPEVLRDHVRRTAPDTVPPSIAVVEAAGETAP